MFGIVDSLRQDARAAARTAALASAGVLLGIVGLGFLTVALWMFIVIVSTPLTAATVIGALYSGVALILLAIASSRRSRVTTDPAPAAAPPPPPPAAPFVQMAEGFAMGMQAGRAARSRRD
ncbi:hypothetical protein G5B38_18370 [Pseudohalocynthiibacter aestuariivivens]|uniref:Phage holin family protein n=1 Tax=Roseovarius pelagicus TaxID=2980108 RepID=A0ABY6DFX3_9RHOB|nr:MULTISPECIES: phage holin family protein [Rhodobacterales]QIE47331.1 hypothetical protein G5B38_18370 [Pseudohalocynthiibacter aestuariivivens]UXX84108.1 phage holin family protein [Roseovarius pelagicus]